MLRRIARRISSKLKKPQTKNERGPSSPIATADVKDEETDEQLPVVEVDEKVLESWVETGREFELIDIREVYEIMQGHLTGAWMIPMNKIPERMHSYPKDKDLVIYCAAGMRSFDVCHYLRQHGFEKTWSLDGGVGAWAQKGYVFPCDSSTWKLTWPAELTAEAAKKRGIEVCQGTVQDIAQTENGVRLTLAVFQHASIEMINGLSPEELTRLSP